MVSNVTTEANRKAITVDRLAFALNGSTTSYRLHVDEETKEVICDHFGGVVTEDTAPQMPKHGGWNKQSHLRREFPDVGRGDFRSPAVRIQHAQGHSLCSLRYQSYTVLDGKPDLPSLPCTIGNRDEVSTLVIHLADDYGFVSADLSYSIFPRHDAIVRSARITNNGSKTIIVNKLASFSIDFPCMDLDLLQLHGDWSRECTRLRRKVEFGLQGFGSMAGCSSHYSNPFLGLVDTQTTETHGEAWGFSLIYSGSFCVELERSPQELTRVLLGIHSDQLSWPLGPGESFVSPECVSVFSNEGIGGMSRRFHRLYRKHLITSQWVNKPRPSLLNCWEGVFFNFNADKIYDMARQSADLGIKLFVMDDGWFGDKYPRTDDHAGLGDWVPNPERFPAGLESLVKRIKQLPVNPQEKMMFGIWVEPEMVNPKSALYEEHPDWALHAGDYPRTECRNQLVLNLALREVQDYIINSMSALLEHIPISYVKWDNNRGIHEVPSVQTYHAYILGLYRTLRKLTSKFPDILWEGCASGGGRFDPGIMHFFPQSWTSDNTDALDRITIQFGTSLVYPPSSMGAHISDVPNDLTKRTMSMTFRAHVAMMAGSFGFELDPAHLTEDEQAQIPSLLALTEKISPIIINGDMWRLNLPHNSNHPAALFISECGNQAVLFAFQIRIQTVRVSPLIRLQGLDSSAFYKLDDGKIFSGATLMNGGLQLQFEVENDSKVILLERLKAAKIH